MNTISLLMVAYKNEFPATVLSSSTHLKTLFIHVPILLWWYAIIPVIQIPPLLKVIQDHGLVEVFCVLGVKSSGFAKCKRRVAGYETTMPVLPRKLPTDSQGMPTQCRSTHRLFRRPMETTPLSKDNLLFRNKNLSLLSCLMPTGCLSLELVPPEMSKLISDVPPTL